ncbi:CRISPR-associated CARF protein Csa3 [Haloarchaeobius amylolyticus]|uniref:CRISPR-associated CARF protein Csa3 n=1 Tax=Haloarchaeobius amylolyticus TaxID=1198296 RepID=UPI00226F2AB1|nr:CRISPR-associated CARF protein Csa3 [Haloarchaeobius amylolyticus]
MKNFILPVGHDTRRVTRPIISHGIDAHDTVVLVRPSDDDAPGAEDSRSSQAIADIRDFLREIEPNAALEVEHVSVDTWTETTLACSDLIQAARNPILGLCGGPRDVLLPMTVAGVIHANELEFAYVFSDLNQSVDTWTLPDLSPSIPEVTKNTLGAVHELGPCSLSELAQHTDSSKSTIGRHLDTLEEAGIIDSWAEGKHRYACVNESARVLAYSALDNDFVDL